MPELFPCPKCERECRFTPRPDTQHYGSIRCPVHGFLWIPKPDTEKKPKRKTNSDLVCQLPENRRDFCWSCLRSQELLKALRPSVCLQVLHILPVAEGGNDHPENLQLLCAECHAEVHRRREAFGRYEQREGRA